MDLLKNMSLQELRDKKKELEEKVNIANAEIAMFDQELSNRPKAKPITDLEVHQIFGAMRRIWSVAEKLSPETRGRFVEGRLNFGLCYNHGDSVFSLCSRRQYQESILPYFPTRELCNRFLRESGTDLRTVFRIKN